MKTNKRLKNGLLLIALFALAIPNYSIAKKKDHELTIGVVSSYIEQSPNDPNLYYLRATMFMDQGKLKKAMADFEHALEVFPEYHDAHLGLARIQYHRKQFDGALKSVELYLSKNENDAQAVMLRSMIQAKRGELLKTAAGLKTVIDMDHKNAAAHMHLGEIYYMAGQFDDAYGEWTTASQLGSAEAEIHIKYSLKSVN